jgi:carboxyl-terminal processing protease
LIGRFARAAQGNDAALAPAWLEESHMSRWNLGWLLGITAAALVGFSVTYSAPSREATVQKKHENLKLLVDVLEEVQDKYVKELDSDKMRELVENMITGGLERLDPHSGFINGDEFKQFQKQSKGRFGGIGIRISAERGLVMVESPMVGTPAYEAGIMAGDFIMKVDGKSTENMQLKDVVEAITGEPGTKVTLSVIHDGAKKAVDIEVTRDIIHIDSVLADRPQPGNAKEWDFWIDPKTRIAYVRVVAFTETTVDELTRVVDGLQKADMKGLVLDLRTNPGGLLKSAVDVSSMFLESGKEVVVTKGRHKDDKEVHTARRISGVKQTASYPIAILLNRFSASASEIVAAALQDYGRAVIIGERSFGKGSVQNVIAMEGGSTALKLTTASYHRPSGKNIHRFPDSKEEEDWGVKPNDGMEVKLTDEERIDYFKWRRQRDIVRRPGEAAPKEPKDNGKDNGNGADKQPKKDFRDRVLDKAVEYLRGEIAKGNGQAALPAPAEPIAQQRERAREASDSRRDIDIRRADAASGWRER